VEKKITKDVTIIHRRDQFRANGDNVNRLSKNKVKILLNQTIAEITDHKIITQEKQSICFQQLIVQYGQNININHLNFLSNLQLDQIKKIIVNQSQETNLKNVFACGNACNYPNKPGTIISGMGEIAVAINTIVQKLKAY
jgi:thioredoxin reductase (NADPH)